MTVPCSVPCVDSDSLEELAMQSTVRTEKTVLVHMRERVRPVTFSHGATGIERELISAVRETFREVLTGKEELVLQVRPSLFYF